MDSLVPIDLDEEKIHGDEINWSTCLDVLFACRQAICIPMHRRCHGKGCRDSGMDEHCHTRHGIEIYLENDLQRIRLVAFDLDKPFNPRRRITTALIVKRCSWSKYKFAGKMSDKPFKLKITTKAKHEQLKVVWKRPGFADLECRVLKDSLIQALHNTVRQ
jgi:hypothetical protein